MTPSQLQKVGLPVPTEEAWKSWLDLPETAWFKQVILNRRQELKDQWEAGRFTDLSQFGTGMLNANAIGKCEAYALLEELDYETLLTELDYEQPQQSQRTESEGTRSAS